MKDLGVMLAVEFLEVTVNTVSKAAMKTGMNDFIFIMYSNALAACILLSVSSIYYWYTHIRIYSQSRLINSSLLIITIFTMDSIFVSGSRFDWGRKRTLPPLTFSIVGQLSIVGFSSWSTQVLKFLGIGYSSPTLASAMSDLLPAFTFILAILFRMENLDWKANSTWAKSFGSLVSIAGALIVTLYKGPPVISHLTHKSFPDLFSAFQSNWVLGGMFLVGQNLVHSLEHIYQTHVIRKYPAELMTVLIRCIVVTVLSVPASLISERDPKAWRLGLNTELMAIGCSALLGLCIRSVTHVWAMKKKGPVYVATFKPVEIVIAVIMGITFLGNTLYLGSVIGAVVIVAGFYAVIWGKAKEVTMEQEDIIVYSSPSSPEVPLLQNKTSRA